MARPFPKPVEIKDEAMKQEILTLTFKSKKILKIVRVRSIKEWWAKNPKSLILCVNPRYEEWYDIHKNGKIFRLQ